MTIDNSFYGTRALSESDRETARQEVRKTVAGVVQKMREYVGQVDGIITMIKDKYEHVEAISNETQENREAKYTLNNNLLSDRDRTFDFFESINTTASALRKSLDIYDTDGSLKDALDRLPAPMHIASQEVARAFADFSKFEGIKKKFADYANALEQWLASVR